MTPKTLAGPVALGNGVYTNNIYNPFSANIYGVVGHIHVNNHGTGTLTFRLFRGATGANAAGTDLFYDKEVEAKKTYDYYCEMRMDSTDFLVGGASGPDLTITVEGGESVK